MQISYGGRRYEWDPAKARSNEQKHGVTFREGITVGADPRGIVEFDARHSSPGEPRWRLTGMSDRLRILNVVFTLRSHGDEEETVRIISARRANREETACYEARFHDDG